MPGDGGHATNVEDASAAIAAPACGVCDRHQSWRAVDFLLDGNSIRTNRHLRRFAAAPYLQELLAAPELQGLWNRRSKSLRKELIEGYVLVDALHTALETRHAEGPSVIVDLCSGKGFSSVLLCKEFPTAHVVMVDSDVTIIPSAALAFPGQVTFEKADIYEKSFPGRLTELVERRSGGGLGWTCLVGMHLCGDLSPRAIELFQQQAFDSLILAPCCLHKLQDASLKALARAEGSDPFEVKVRDLSARLRGERGLGERFVEEAVGLSTADPASESPVTHESPHSGAVDVEIVRDTAMRTNTRGAESEGGDGVRNVLIIAVKR